MSLFLVWLIPAFIGGLGVAFRKGYDPEWWQGKDEDARGWLIAGVMFWPAALFVAIGAGCSWLVLCAPFSALQWLGSFAKGRRDARLKREAEEFAKNQQAADRKRWYQSVLR